MKPTYKLNNIANIANQFHLSLQNILDNHTTRRHLQIVLKKNIVYLFVSVSFSFVRLNIVSCVFFMNIVY